MVIPKLRHCRQDEAERGTRGAWYDNSPNSRACGPLWHIAVRSASRSLQERKRLIRELSQVW
jgi:hypothetical protein